MMSGILLFFIAYPWVLFVVAGLALVGAFTTVFLIFAAIQVTRGKWS